MKKTIGRIKEKHGGSGSCCVVFTRAFSSCCWAQWHKACHCYKLKCDFLVGFIATRLKTFLCKVGMGAGSLRPLCEAWVNLHPQSCSSATAYFSECLIHTISYVTCVLNGSGFVRRIEVKNTDSHEVQFAYTSQLTVSLSLISCYTRSKNQAVSFQNAETWLLREPWASVYDSMGLIIAPATCNSWLLYLRAHKESFTVKSFILPETEMLIDKHAYVHHKGVFQTVLDQLGPFYLSDWECFRFHGGSGTGRLLLSSLPLLNRCLWSHHLNLQYPDRNGIQPLSIWCGVNVC